MPVERMVAAAIWLPIVAENVPTQRLLEHRGHSMPITRGWRQEPSSSTRFTLTGADPSYWDLRPGVRAPRRQA